MIKLLTLSILCCFSMTTSAQINVRLKVLSTRDSVNFSPVQDVVVDCIEISSHRINRPTNPDGEYWLYNQDSSIFKSTFDFDHPVYSFPRQKLIDFPYQLKNGEIIFTIIGTPTPRPEYELITVKAASSNKFIVPDVTVRCLASNPTDSLVLLDLEGEFLASFDPDLNFGIHSAKKVDWLSVSSGGYIVNLSDADTTRFGFNDWKYIIPQVSIAPVKRSKSELATLCKHFRFMNELREEYRAESKELTQKITQLEDSITDILDPNRLSWKSRGPVVIPRAGIIDGVYIRNSTQINSDEINRLMEGSLPEIISAHKPKKSGKIVYEIYIDRHGNTYMKTIALSRGYEEIDTRIHKSFQNAACTPYSINGHTYPSTQILEILITD